MPVHPSELVADAIVRALADSGVRDVVYCPGSRSAPLAYALAGAERQGRLRVHIRLDERGAAFVALGLSRAGSLRGDGVPPSDEGVPAASTASADVPGDRVPAMRAISGCRPVAVVTTSGGAVAELHAGVAEAAHSGVPLIVVSADRPFELRGVGASQTTDQPGLFGPQVQDVWDVPAGAVPDRSLSALVARAVAAACGLPTGVPGPVQLNVGFRDPLAPTVPTVSTAPSGADGSGGPAPAGPSSSRVQPIARVVPAVPRATAWEEVVDPGLRTVLVAGDGAHRDAGRWAEAAAIPLLAEPTSGATTASAWTPHQQTLLSGPLARAIQQVVVTGRPTLSRTVGALLARDDVRVVVQSSERHWTDVAGHAAAVVPLLAPALAPSADGAWARRWEAASRAVGRRLSGLIGDDQEAAPTLASAARAVWEADAGDGTVLLLGASNTVRAVDLVACGHGRGDVVSNRGLAGIDGTIATALGLAWGSGRPVRAVMGDLTFLHDASSLMLSESNADPDVQVVVLDDHGGGIFAGLEHGRPEYAGVFGRWFGTAQRASVAGVARAYGAGSRSVATLGELREALAQPVSRRKVVHVPVPRDPGLLAAVRELTPEEP